MQPLALLRLAVGGDCGDVPVEDCLDDKGGKEEEGNLCGEGNRMGETSACAVPSDDDDDDIAFGGAMKSEKRVVVTLLLLSLE
eukprot:13953111-Ditylum_brightwellii.AAC.1